jgi:hypothetical protein
MRARSRPGSGPGARWEAPYSVARQCHRCASLMASVPSGYGAGCGWKGVCPGTKILVIGRYGTDTATATRLYGPAVVRSWNRLHPRLTHHSSWGAATGHPAPPGPEPRRRPASAMRETCCRATAYTSPRPTRVSAPTRWGRTHRPGRWNPGPQMAGLVRPRNVEIRAGSSPSASASWPARLSGMAAQYDGALVGRI